MRRALVISIPLLFLIAIAAIFGIARSQDKDPFGPLRRLVVIERTRYVPERPDTGGQVLETSAIISADAAGDQIRQFQTWLQKDAGWSLHGYAGTSFTYATHGRHVVPDAWLFMHKVSENRYSLIYERRLNALEGLIDSGIYKTRDINEMPLEAATQNPVNRKL